MKLFRTILVALLLCYILPVMGQERTGSIITVEGVQYYVHTVQKGETVYGLSRLYNVKEGDLLRANPHVGDNLQEGQVLKIRVDRSGEKQLNRRQMRRTFETHTVRQGETLYAISRKYGISVGTLMEDNLRLDPTRLSLGQTLNIRKSEQGNATGWQITQEMEEYRNAINSVTTDGQYYLIKSGDTLYGLAEAFGVSVEQIEAANDLSGGLKAGQLVKMPGRSAAVVQPQQPRPRFGSRRDSLLYVREQMRIARERDGRRGDVIQDISARRMLNVSLLLPLSNEDGTPHRDRDGFMQFYYGALIGLEDLKEQGISTNLSVFDTRRSPDITANIAGSEEFRATDLVIGPVYGEGLHAVAAFAENKGIPVVSPLQRNEGLESPVLFQMAPSQEDKYIKLRAMLARPELNLIYITTSASDADMDTNLRPQLPGGVRPIDYMAESFTADLENALEKRSGENVIIVSCTSAQVVDQVLGHISSVQSNLVARSILRAGVCVVGNSGWARFPTASVDHELYFKLRLCFVTNYHADRADGRVRDFDRRYIEAFSAVPSLFSYRGYDAVKLFGGALMIRGNDFVRKVNGSNQTLLQMPYRFGQTTHGGSYCNTEWVLVRYGADYSIEVE